MRAALIRHDAIAESAAERHAGCLVRPRGEGDSHFYVFPCPLDAVAAAATIQEALLHERWSMPEPLRVRMALHTGEANLRDGDYYGPVVNRCARLRGIAHGGQVLLSGATYALVQESPPSGVSFLDLGEHHLPDIAVPERAHQILTPSLPATFPPLRCCGLAVAPAAYSI
jgi:class 3 adenylate cyclase